MNQAEIAIALLAKLPGTRVFLLPPLTKKPRGGSWKTDASDDPEVIRDWFNVMPDSNVGFVIGDRVAVIDVEGPKKKREEAREGLAELRSLEQTYGKLPPTLTVCTPSDGKHQYYMLPSGITINRKAELLSSKGIELRSGTHFVILPPSRIENDLEGHGSYFFADGLGLNDVEIATLPNAWVDAILKYDEPGKAAPSRRDYLFQSASSGAAERKPAFEPIVTGCAFMQHVVEDAAELSEPDWYAGLSIVTRCENGDELAHKISAPYPGYTVAATDRKIEHALTAAKPVTCGYIGKELGFSGCQRCPFRAGATKSPIALGYQKPELVEEQTRLVYVADIERCVDITTGRRYTRASLSDMLSHRVGKNPHGQLMASKTMPKVESADYRVGNDQLIVESDGYKVLNLWRRDGVEPCEGDASTLLAFVEHLIPDQVSREHLLNYLAHMLQRRGEKIAHAIIVTGPQGTGKSTLARIAQRLFGCNTSKVHGERLASKWNEPLVNCELLIAEETALNGKWESYNELKPLITEETFTVEQKNVPPYDGRTPRGFLILSNYDAPLSLPDDDRRYCVMASVDEKASAEFFEKVNRAIDDDTQLGALAARLLKRDITKFNPKAGPPMTAAKDTAIAASRTPLAQIISEAIENGTLKGDVVTGDQVLQILKSPWQVTTNISPQKLAAALKQVGAIKLAKVRVPSGSSTNPWALRNHEFWKNAGPDEVRKALGWVQPIEGAPLYKMIDLAMRQAAREAEAV